MVDTPKDLLSAATDSISDVGKKRTLQEMVHRKHFLIISPRNKRETTL